MMTSPYSAQARSFSPYPKMGFLLLLGRLLLPPPLLLLLLILLLIPRLIHTLTYSYSDLIILRLLHDTVCSHPLKSIPIHSHTHSHSYSCTFFAVQLVSSNLDLLMLIYTHNQTHSYTDLLIPRLTHAETDSYQDGLILRLVSRRIYIQTYSYSDLLILRTTHTQTF